MDFVITLSKYICIYSGKIISDRPVGAGGGGSRGSNEPPLEGNNGGLKTQTVDFQLLANSGGMGNKLKLPSRKTLIVL